MKASSDLRRWVVEPHNRSFLERLRVWLSVLGWALRHWPQKTVCVAVEVRPGDPRYEHAFPVTVYSSDFEIHGPN